MGARSWEVAIDEVRSGGDGEVDKSSIAVGERPR
jgi:hypothetical protein